MPVNPRQMKKNIFKTGTNSRMPNDVESTTINPNMSIENSKSVSKTRDKSGSVDNRNSKYTPRQLRSSKLNMRQQPTHGSNLLAKHNRPITQGGEFIVNQNLITAQQNQSNTPYSNYQNSDVNIDKSLMSHTTAKKHPKGIPGSLGQRELENDVDQASNPYIYSDYMPDQPNAIRNVNISNFESKHANNSVIENI